VSIRAGNLACDLFLDNRMRNVCQSLNGEKLRKLANVQPPTRSGPNDSTSTIFGFVLFDQEDQPTMETNELTQPHIATNTILYGPPGTGKTYQSAWEAVRLCCGERVASGLEGSDQRAALMSIYRNLVSDGRIEFVTFHQSMSYEELVGGLRPPPDQAQKTSRDTGFRLEPVAGIFRRISERAEKGVPVASSENSLSLDGRQVFKMSIGRANIASEDYLFDEAISEDHTLLGWEDIDFTDDKFSNVNEILKACREDGLLEGEASLQSGQVSQVDVFRNKLEIGDIIVVTKGNSLFRAIGEITGNYEYLQRDNRDYCHRRSVRWQIGRAHV